MAGCSGGLYLGPDGAKEEALAEDVHREEAHQIPELHRHDLFFLEGGRVQCEVTGGGEGGA